MAACSLLAGALLQGIARKATRPAVAVVPIPTPQVTRAETYSLAAGK
jgi:hypothetical protein